MELGRPVISMLNVGAGLDVVVGRAEVVVVLRRRVRRGRRVVGKYIILVWRWWRGSWKGWV